MTSGKTEPDHWADPKRGSILELHNLRHRSTRVQNWKSFGIQQGVWEPLGVFWLSFVTLTIWDLLM